MLSRYLPFLQGLGVSAEWRLIHGDPAFFTITKAFHNALQGGHYALHESEQDTYLKVNKQSAELLDNNYDVSSCTIRNLPPFVTSPVPAERNGSGVVT